MGREARCLAELGDWTGEGKLLLETDELIFRGAQRLALPRGAIADVAASGGWLEVRHGGGVARFDLGAAAAKWADAIRNPRTLTDKLGVKPTSRVAAVGVADDALLAQLRAASDSVATVDSVVELAESGFDIIVYGADAPEALEALPALRERIAQAGAVWVVSPKRRPEIADVVVMAAAKRSGLVDVKTARISDTHTSLKLVIPRAQRR